MLDGIGPVKRLWDYRLGIEVTPEFLNDQLGDTQHVDSKMHATLQYTIFYCSMQRQDVRVQTLKGIYKKMREENPDNPFLEQVRTELRNERMQFFGSLILVCNRELEQDPKVVAAIFRIYLTLNWLREDEPTPLAGQLSLCPAAIEFVEEQWHDRFQKQLELGEQFWSKYGDDLALEYQAYDAATFKPSSSGGPCDFTAEGFEDF